jgi:hypothetical protein
METIGIVLLAYLSPPHLHPEMGQTLQRARLKVANVSLMVTIGTVHRESPSLQLLHLVTSPNPQQPTLVPASVSLTVITGIVLQASLSPLLLQRARSLSLPHCAV